MRLSQWARSALTTFGLVMSKTTSPSPKKALLLHKNHMPSQSSLVIDFGTPGLVKGIVVARPSKTIKSPYVADVIIPKDEARASDMVTSFFSSEQDNKENKKKITKKERDDRNAETYKYLSGIDGSLELAHAPSLDCAGTVIPGGSVYLSASTSQTAKTAYAIQLCEEQRLGEPNVIIGYHPSLAERALKHLIENDSEFLSLALGLNMKEKEDVFLSSQRTFGESRFDFVVETSTKIILVETKNVVGADYIQGTVPPQRSPVGVYTIPPQEALTMGYKRAAIFPHGTNPKPGLPVISDRAIKHLNCLIQLHGSTIDNKAVECAVIFMINRSDCDVFRPCHEADMLFAQMLQRAKHVGVKVHAQELQWTPQGQCTKGKALPVIFGASVKQEDVDEAVLRKVLEYNAEHGNGRKPSSSSSPSTSKAKAKGKGKGKIKGKSSKKDSDDDTDTDDDDKGDDDEDEDGKEDAMSGPSKGNKTVNKATKTTSKKKISVTDDNNEVTRGKKRKANPTNEGTILEEKVGRSESRRKEREGET